MGEMCAGLLFEGYPSEHLFPFYDEMVINREDRDGRFAIHFFPVLFNRKRLCHVHGRLTETPGAVDVSFNRQPTTFHAQ